MVKKVSPRVFSIGVEAHVLTPFLNALPRSSTPTRLPRRMPFMSAISGSMKRVSGLAAR